MPRTHNLTVYSLTTDGDNMPIETSVFASEDEAKADIIAGLESAGHRRCSDGRKLSAGSLEELCDLWTETFDGVCTVEAHEIACQAPA